MITFLLSMGIQNIAAYGLTSFGPEKLAVPYMFYSNTAPNSVSSVFFGFTRGLFGAPIIFQGSTAVAAGFSWAWIGGMALQLVLSSGSYQIVSHLNPLNITSSRLYDAVSAAGSSGTVLEVLSTASVLTAHGHTGTINAVSNAGVIGANGWSATTGDFLQMPVVTQLRASDFSATTLLSYVEYIHVPITATASSTWGDLFARTFGTLFSGNPVNRTTSGLLYGQLTGQYNFLFSPVDTTTMVQNATVAETPEVEPPVQEGYSTMTIILIILGLLLVVALIWAATQYLL
jgi:hypothetical protein